MTQHPLHSIENAGALDSRFRHLLQPPNRILKNLVHAGMTVLDLGCGTGYFTTELAQLVGPSGKVLAIDVQEQMLEILKRKLIRNPLYTNIQVSQSRENHLGVNIMVDFILAFYTFHEMRNLDVIIRELKTILKPGAKVLIAEQKLHVSKQTFQTIVDKMSKQGFSICGRPKIFFSRSLLMEFRK